MNRGRAIAVDVEVMGSRGEGVAPGPVYLPFALPGERALARVVGQRGEIESLLRTSADRIDPPCPHFGDCGGCALQHWRADSIARWKRGRIAEALARSGLQAQVLETVTVEPAQRRRMALHARSAGGRVALGLKAARTWRVVNLETCLVCVPAIVEALPALGRIALPLFQNADSAPILHVTSTQTGLDVEVSGIAQGRDGVSADSRRRAAQVAAEADLARLTLGGETLYQARAPIVLFDGISVTPPPGAFLQACSSAEKLMTDFVMSEASGARRIIDLYCGVGAFSLPLSRLAPVNAADASAEAVRALLAATGSPGTKAVAAEARDLDRRPILARDLRRGDVAVFDPPRAGAAVQCLELARSPVSKIIAVSCNPTTFGRDAAILASQGWRPARVLPVDQFLWSAHIELVAVFERGGADR